MITHPLLPSSVAARFSATHAQMLGLLIATQEWANAAHIGDALLARTGPTAKPAWYAHTATAHLKLGDRTTATHVLEAGRTTHPDSTLLDSHLLSLSITTQDWATAAHIGDALLARTGPTAKPAWHAHTATAHLKLGDHTTAERVLQAGRTTHPETTLLDSHLLSLSITTQDWATAAHIGDALLARTGPTAKPAWHAHTATAHLKLGDHTTAERVLEAGGPLAAQHRDGQWTRALLDAHLHGKSLDYGRMGVLKFSPQQRRDLSDAMPTHAFGSYTKGIIDWQHRWDEASPDHRVIMIAPKDFSGSMFKLAAAANRYSPYAVRLVTFHPHEFGYANDLVIPEITDARRDLLLREVDRCRIIHLKDEHSWFNDARGINADLLRELFYGDLRRHYRTVFTTYGGWARSHKDNADWQAGVLSFDARTAMTPDLNFDWYHGDLLPHAIDTDNLHYCWTDSKVIGHSSATTKPQRKGTELLFEAVRQLEKQRPRGWAEWEATFIIGVSHDVAMARKRGLSLYFDQAGREPGNGPLAVDDVIGWYGNAAIEALVMGIPTLVHIRRDAADRAARAGVDVAGWPLIQVDRDPADIADKIRRFVMASGAEREALSHKSRAFAEKYHSYQALAARLGDVYGRVTRSPRTAAQPSVDIGGTSL